MTLSRMLIGLCVGLFITGLATRAEAFSFSSSISDTGDDAYWGGTDETGDSPWGDVIGTDPPFGINSMTIYKDEGDDTLYVNIFTNYSGSNVGALTTSAGALFLGNPNLILNGDPQTNILPAADIFYDGVGGHADDTTRFSHALDYTDANGNVVANPGTGQLDSGSGGEARLYALDGTALDVVTTNHGGTNRNFQAYDVNHAVNDPFATAAGSAWYTEAGLFSFTIADFFSAENPLTATGGIYEFGATFAWTMLCGNDVILGAIGWDPGGATGVPLPAGIILLFSALFGMGFLGRLKARKATA